jgi:hypothetical protein
VLILRFHLAADGISPSSERKETTGWRWWRNSHSTSEDCSALGAEQRDGMELWRMISVSSSPLLGLTLSLIYNEMGRV